MPSLRLALWALILWLASWAQVSEPYVEKYASGADKVQCEMRRNTRGELVRHGAFKSWYENGQLESEGRYDAGAQQGPWVFHHDNGAVAESGSLAHGQRTGRWMGYFAGGAKRCEGKYAKDHRDGKWSFWLENGDLDRDESGEYRFERLERADHATRADGYRLDNLRHGTWTLYWPSGAKQFEGSYSRSFRQGPWTFWHENGSPSAVLLSGVYTDGQWTSPLPAASNAANPNAPSSPAPGSLPMPALVGDMNAIEAKLLNERIAAFLAAEPKDAMWIRDEILAVGHRAMPILLERMLALDPTRAEDRATLMALESKLVRGITRGHGLGFPAADPSTLADPAAWVAACRETVSAWTSLWAITSDDDEFWCIDVRLTPVAKPPPPVSALLARVPLLDEERPGAASQSTRQGLYLNRVEAKADLKALGGVGTEDALKRALHWLADHQAPDGSWSSDAFAAQCGKRGKTACDGAGIEEHDLGVTALALLAFLADGNTTRQGVYSSTVARGIGWLLRWQRTGIFLYQRRSSAAPADSQERRFRNSTTYDHALATSAVCEAAQFSGHPLLAQAAQAAIDALQSAQNPSSGWRYAFPPNGESDTSVTAWAVQALKAGERAGLKVDPAALAGGLEWIDLVTDPETGRIGYNSIGSISSRTVESEKIYPADAHEAMTGAGLFVRLLCGQTAATNPILAKNADLIFTHLPEWDNSGARNDCYAWYYESYALFHFADAKWEKWNQALKSMLLTSQRQDGDAAGSWDPHDAWGFVGGRVYETAMMSLCLEVYYRYPRRPPAKKK